MEHKIKRMALTDLTPADYNPREISDEALEGLTASIERFGLVQPIIYNERTGNVVGGHQRLQVLIATGKTHTKVVCVDLAEGEEKALNLALNNPETQGTFTGAVQSIIAELQVTLPDLTAELRLDLLADLEVPDVVGDTAKASGPEKAINYESQFAVAVLCKSERHQERVYKELTKLGYTDLKVVVV